MQWPLYKPVSCTGATNHCQEVSIAVKEVTVLYLRNCVVTIADSTVYEHKQSPTVTFCRGPAVSQL